MARWGLLQWVACWTLRHRFADWGLPHHQGARNETDLHTGNHPIRSTRRAGVRPRKRRIEMTCQWLGTPTTPTAKERQDGSTLNAHVSHLLSGH